jgi:hypothetical protein
MKTTLYIVIPICLVGCSLTAEESSRTFGGRSEPILSSHQERGDLPEGVPFSYDPNWLSDDESESIVTTSSSRFGEAGFSYPDRALLSGLGVCLGIQIGDLIRFSVIGIAPKQGPPAV